MAVRSPIRKDYQPGNAVRDSAPPRARRRLGARYISPKRPETVARLRCSDKTSPHPSDGCLDTLRSVWGLLWGICSYHPLIPVFSDRRNPATSPQLTGNPRPRVRSHNPEVGGSNPSPATTSSPRNRSVPGAWFSRVLPTPRAGTNDARAVCFGSRDPAYNGRQGEARTP